jgi:hypothetical protein
MATLIGKPRSTIPKIKPCKRVPKKTAIRGDVNAETPEEAKPKTAAYTYNAYVWVVASSGKNEIANITDNPMINTFLFPVLSATIPQATRPITLNPPDVARIVAAVVAEIPISIA